MLIAIPIIMCLIFLAVCIHACHEDFDALAAFSFIAAAACLIYTAFMLGHYVGWN